MAISTALSSPLSKKGGEHQAGHGHVHQPDHGHDSRRAGQGRGLQSLGRGQVAQRQLPADADGLAWERPTAIWKTM